MEKKSFIRSILIIILTLIICCVLFSISTIFQIGSLKLELEIDKVLSKSNECKPEYFSFLRKEDGISVIISIVLMIIYFSCVLFERRKNKKKESSKVNRPQNSTGIELSNLDGGNNEGDPFLTQEISDENSNANNTSSNRNGNNTGSEPFLTQEPPDENVNSIYLLSNREDRNAESPPDSSTVFPCNETKSQKGIEKKKCLNKIIC